MKSICNIIIISLISSAGFAQDSAKVGKVDELTKAYQREILFLSTYRKELESKRKSLKKNLGSQLTQAKSELQGMEKKWLRQQTSNELLIQKLSEIEKDQENRKENREILEITIEQAAAGKSKEQVKADQKPNLVDRLTQAFSQARVELDQGLTVSNEKGSFYLASGEQTQGEIIQMGRVARFAAKDGRIASLSPSGAGSFRVHQWLSNESLVLTDGQMPKFLPLFLFDNPEKEFIAAKEKTTMDVIRSGGLIGWIIIVMGLFALMISLFRFYLLKKAGQSDRKNLKQVISEIQKNHLDDAQHLLLAESNSVNRVLGKTLSFLKSEPEKVEDAILEAILQESKTIDRFGVVILVIASVAPLMGLLGTVTGMISTFDIITLYGTGNPKLLSGGISEALVTTMFGLIVAIPALLVGQYLTAKSEAIKTDMEQWALATCNAFKNKGES